MSSADDIIVVPSEPQHAEAMTALMALVYDLPPDGTTEIFTPEMYRHHLAVFPEGQFTAWHGDKIVGVTASMRFSFDPDHPKIEPWWEAVGRGWLKHEPDGEWMYGVESHVHPDYQGRGIGGVLIEARFDTARLLNLRGMIAGSTLLSYAFHAHEATPQEYVRGVLEGRFFDDNLSKQIRKGLMPIEGATIPDYVKDPTSLGWGSVVMWRNPDYNADSNARAHMLAELKMRRYTLPLRPAKRKG
jgi:GNAT superfamily N-acetyltransferase